MTKNRAEPEWVIEEHDFVPHYPLRTTYDVDLVDSLASRCNAASGARELRQHLTQTLPPERSVPIAERMTQDERPTRIHIGVAGMRRLAQ